MLTYLQIRDFAIVDRLELEFAAGMSAITGETGAGKSILLDALGLLLGDRADSDTVKTGAERAEIAATFDIAGLAPARAWLAERELNNGDGSNGECHLRRLIGAQGRSRAFINGVSQPLAAMKSLGELLVDIHGQHENQSLLKRDLQRRLLDDYAGHQSLLKPDQQRRVLDDFGGHQRLLDELSGSFRRWQELRRRLRQLKHSDGEQAARVELLQFQVQELETLALGDDELPALELEHRRLANAEQLLDVSQRALTRVYEAEQVSAHSILSRCCDELGDLAGADPKLGAIAELLNGALIQVAEASEELRDYLQDVDLDPGRLQWIEQRLADVYAQARKHRIDPVELPQRLRGLRDELDQLANSEQHIEAVERDIAAALDTYNRCAERLSRQRRAAAAEMGERISQAVRELGMPDAQFGVELIRHDQPTEHGMEGVEFLISANPGQPPRALTRVASGGELSRISLAIHVIAADSARIPTLIFDEVDTGIGGAVAEVVGRRLRELGERRQVLCVTHLPQVAAQAHHQFQVCKQVRGKQTRTEVLSLGAKQRVEEIARMLGGVKLTKNSLAHAREMIKRAQT